MPGSTGSRLFFLFCVPWVNFVLRKLSFSQPTTSFQQSKSSLLLTASPHQLTHPPPTSTRENKTKKRQLQRHVHSNNGKPPNALPQKSRRRSVHRDAHGRRPLGRGDGRSVRPALSRDHGTRNGSRQAIEARRSGPADDRFGTSRVNLSS